MKVSYKQSIADYKSAISYLNQELLKGTKWRFLAKFSGGVLGFLFVFGAMSIVNFYDQYQFLDMSTLSTGLSLITIGVLTFVIGIKISSSQISKKIFSPIGINSHDIEIEITEEYLLLSQNGNLHKYQWSNFLKLAKTDFQIYMFMEPAMAVYVPAHAFNEDHEYESFYKKLEQSFEKTQ